MIEAQVEKRLKRELEFHGFKVLKLTTSGNSGVMDRMILRPKWSPGPPMFVEVKKPGEKPRRLQEEVAIDWHVRGALVLPYVSTYEEVDALVDKLVKQAQFERIDAL